MSRLHRHKERDWLVTPRFHFFPKHDNRYWRRPFYFSGGIGYGPFVVRAATRAGAITRVRHELTKRGYLLDGCDAVPDVGQPIEFWRDRTRIRR